MNGEYKSRHDHARTGIGMNILFIHQNFPGQYRHTAKALAADPANRVVALAMHRRDTIAGVQLILHTDKRPQTSLHPYLGQYEKQIQNGLSVARAAQELRQSGFTPDVICAHPGWGEALFIKSVYPEARLLCFQEFYYRTSGSDIGFDPEFMPKSRDYPFTTVLRNATINHSLSVADVNLCPTQWQKQQFPALYHPHITVVHDGIDTDLVRPDPAACFVLTMPDGSMQLLTAQDEVVTFVSRNLEPYRGIHSFLRSLPDLLARRPHARVIVVGGDDVSYGTRLPDGQTYRQHYLAEIVGKYDASRVHFIGRIPYQAYLTLLQISSAHIYLTYPFVLSWSMLEAMSAGCTVIGSNTAPVQEVIRHGDNGLLVDFFSPADIVEKICTVLADPTRMASMRSRGRQTVIDSYDLHRICLPRQLELVRRG